MKLNIIYQCSRIVEKWQLFYRRKSFEGYLGGGKDRGLVDHRQSISSEPKCAYREERNIVSRSHAARRRGYLYWRQHFSWQ